MSSEDCFSKLNAIVLPFLINFGLPTNVLVANSPNTEYCRITSRPISHTQPPWTSNLVPCSWTGIISSHVHTTTCIHPPSTPPHFSFMLHITINFPSSLLFYRKLSIAVADNFEVHICKDHSHYNEDVAVEKVELYVL